MKTGSTVQVAGSLNIPAYRLPLITGVTLCVLAPVALGLEHLGWQGVGRLRGMVMLLTWLGPVWLLVGGVACLSFAMAVRQAQVFRRRDLEVGEDGFALIDRQGRREFADSDILSFGFRSRSAPLGTVTTQKGQAHLELEGRDGPEQVDLDWEYPDGEENPLEPWLERILNRLHALASAAIDRGESLVGEGWEVFRLGLQAGASADLIPFDDMTLAEYHEGQLRVWTKGNVEPSFQVKEGSKNEANLFAIINERMPNQPEPGLGAGTEVSGMGRVLFKRRWSFVDCFGLWFLCSFLGVPLLIGAGFLIYQLDLTSLLAIIPLVLAVVVYLPALARQVSIFRCHEAGVSRKGLFGLRELPFADLQEVKVRVQENSSLVRLGFKPIKGRGRKSITLYLKTDDQALETLQLYVPGGIPTG